MTNGLALNNLQSLLEFPFRRPNGTQKLVVGAGLLLLSFAVPIVPGLFVAGYLWAVTRHAIQTGELVLPEWNDWSTLLVDGLKVTGVTLLFLLPAFMAFGLGYGGMMGTSVAAAIVEDAGPSELTPLMGFLLLGSLAGVAAFGVGMILMLAASAILPVALTHMIAKDEFAAAFAFREWGAILRANLGGFLLGYMLMLGLSFVLTIAIQILQLTIVLCCLVPVVVAAYWMYTGTVGSGLFGLIYREGVEKLRAVPAEVSAPPEVPPAPPAPALG